LLPRNGSAAVSLGRSGAGSGKIGVKGRRIVNIVRELFLVKGSERFVFRYPPGREADVIDTLASMAQDPRSSFDWFDAAVLSYQLGRRLEKELEPV
jgi:hypothetical protein